jgi:hypothetical protein
MGRVEEAAQLLELVVAMDRKYQLPKLEENIRRLHTLRERLSNDASREAARGSHG